MYLNPLLLPPQKTLFTGGGERSKTAAAAGYARYPAETKRGSLVQQPTTALGILQETSSLSRLSVPPSSFEPSTQRGIIWEGEATTPPTPAEEEGKEPGIRLVSATGALQRATAEEKAESKAVSAPPPYSREEAVVPYTGTTISNDMNEINVLVYELRSRLVFAGQDIDTVTEILKNLEKYLTTNRTQVFLILYLSNLEVYAFIEDKLVRELTHRYLMELLYTLPSIQEGYPEAYVKMLQAGRIID